MHYPPDHAMTIKIPPENLNTKTLIGARAESTDEKPGQGVSADLRSSWAPAVNEDAAQTDFHVKGYGWTYTISARVARCSQRS